MSDSFESDEVEGRSFGQSGFNSNQEFDTPQGRLIKPGSGPQIATAFKPTKKPQMTPSPPSSSSSSIPYSGDATTINKNFHNTGNQYQFDYETSDGIKRTEEGEIKSIDGVGGIVMKGEYEYVAPDGNVYKVS